MLLSRGEAEELAAAVARQEPRAYVWIAPHMVAGARGYCVMVRVPGGHRRAVPLEFPDRAGLEAWLSGRMEIAAAGGIREHGRRRRAAEQLRLFGGGA